MWISKDDVNDVNKNVGLRTFGFNMKIEYIKFLLTLRQDNLKFWVVVFGFLRDTN